MEKAAKKETIEVLTAKFNAATNFYLADASNLTVADVNKLRRLCHKQGVEMRVAKNTLIRKALEATGKQYEGIIEVLHGPTSIMFSEGASVPAKVIKEFRKAGERPVLKAAYIDSAIYIGDKSVIDLATLKSKEELVGEIIGLLQSPAKNVISALLSGGQKLSGILKTLEDRKES
ncbi:MAG TPA: 50S ribosomal protein L10 [Chitinophagales bacterium]|nr:50S ribosomal protein L10 [Chitinophagales bacterium]